MPTTETGTAISGMMDARQVCRKRITTRTTRKHGLEERALHRADRLAHKDGRIPDHLIGDTRGKACGQLLKLAVNRIGNAKRVGAGRQEDAGRCRVLVALENPHRVVASPKFDPCDVGQDGPPGRLLRS